jgi:hypothetical protein
LAQERVALVLAGRPPELVEVMLWFGWELFLIVPISGKKLRDTLRPVFKTPLYFFVTEDSIFKTLFKCCTFNILENI